MKNGLVTQDQLDAAQRGATESGKSLPEVLVIQQALTKQKVDAIVAAIERKMAEKSEPLPPEEPAIAAPPPKPKLKPGELPEAIQKSSIEREYERGESEIKRLIRHIVTSTLHQKLLEHVVQGRISVLEPNALAARVSSNKNDILKVLKRWQRFRVASPLGGGTYNFSPGEKDRKLIDLFLRCWKQPELHGGLMSYILEQGGK